MIVSSFFDQVNGAFRGSDDDVPTADPDLQLWYDTANRKIDEWITDPGNLEPGTVETNGTTTLTGTGTLFTKYSAGDIITVNGETEREIDSVTSDTELEVTVAFTNSETGENFKRRPEVITLTTTGDTIPVEDPYWLVYATASELAFNDLTYEDKFPALNAKANALYRAMKKNKRRVSNSHIRKVPTSVNRITGTRSES